MKKSNKNKNNIRNIFDKIPKYYDNMNDIMSLGLHRLWKDQALSYLYMIPNQANYLDLACGTGDIAKRVQKKNSNINTILIDPSINMLKIAAENLENSLQRKKNIFILGEAEALPLASQSIHTISFSFGLRNTNNQEKSLEEVYRVMQPYGQLIMIEFHRPEGIIGSIYNYYQKYLPIIGGMIYQDSESYEYLKESIMAQAPKEEIKAMMDKIGYKKLRIFSILEGLVVIYHASKEL